MSLTSSQFYPVKPTDKPRAVLTIPPRTILSDELRLVRLEQYLEAEFPDLTVVVATENRGVPDLPAAGVMPVKDGTSTFSEEEANDVLGRVVEAMALFIDYDTRLH